MVLVSMYVVACEPRADFSNVNHVRCKATKSNTSNHSRLGGLIWDCGRIYFRFHESGNILVSTLDWEGRWNISGYAPSVFECFKVVLFHWRSSSILCWSMAFETVGGVLDGRIQYCFSLITAAKTYET